MVDTSVALMPFSVEAKLDPSNCLDIWTFAQTHTCIELGEIAAKFSQDKIQEVMKMEEFLKLTLAL